MWHRHSCLCPHVAMICSVILYIAFAVLLVALISLVRPLHFLRIRTRMAAAVLAAAASGVIAVAMLWPAPAMHKTIGSARLDDVMPAWQFNEEHSIHVAASPERTFKAIHDVRASEIAFFQLLTWIRRGGRPGPESIINAPETKPLLDVATQTSFLLLANDAPREVVVGTVIIAPREARKNGRLSADLFHRQLKPGVALATMNFLVTPDGRGGSNVSTETRVYANDATSLRFFAAYWRVVHPGSDIIRRMWLRAIRARAESASA